MFKNSVTKANYAQKAEEVILYLFGNKQDNRPSGGYGDNRARGGRKPEKQITTTQIRNLLTLINQLYNDVITASSGETLSEDFRSRFEYLRVKMVYESGRTGEVKTFIKRAGLLDMQSEVGGDRGKFILFCRYFEALVAYHKYHGGD
jgi:CRISPR-associated protein Csm2